METILLQSVKFIMADVLITFGIIILIVVGALVRIMFWLFDD